jgi:hypothetical protein
MALFSRARPSSFLPRPAYALTCSPRAPPAPLLSHGARHRPTSAPLRCSRAAAGTPGPNLLPPRGTIRTGPPLLHPSLHAAPPSWPPCFPLRFGAKAAACPLSPISSATRESGLRKPPTPPPHSSVAKCPLLGVRFYRPSPEIAEKPPQPHLFGGLRCSPSPSQNGCTSSCSLSLWSPGTRPHRHWP